MWCKWGQHCTFVFAVGFTSTLKSKNKIYMLHNLPLTLQPFSARLVIYKFILIYAQCTITENHSCHCQFKLHRQNIIAILLLLDNVLKGHTPFICVGLIFFKIIKVI